MICSLLQCRGAHRVVACYLTACAAVLTCLLNSMCCTLHRVVTCLLLKCECRALALQDAGTIPTCCPPQA